MTKRSCEPVVEHRYIVLKIPLDISRQLCEMTLDTNKALNAKIMQYIVQGLSRDTRPDDLNGSRKARRFLK